jgi:hypothetical protein
VPFRASLPSQTERAGFVRPPFGKILCVPLLRRKRNILSTFHIPEHLALILDD